MSTCNRPILETLGSWPIMPQNLPKLPHTFWNGVWEARVKECWSLDMCLTLRSLVSKVVPLFFALNHPLSTPFGIGGLCRAFQKCPSLDWSWKQKFIFDERGTNLETKLPNVNLDTCQGQHPFPSTHQTLIQNLRFWTCAASIWGKLLEVCEYIKLKIVPFGKNGMFVHAMATS